MKAFKVIHCEKCNMEYEIQCDDDNFEEPNKCASCGDEEIETVKSGYLF